MNKCLVCVDIYTVKSGDTLYSIATKYNISTALLMKANLIKEPEALPVGFKLCIPGFEDELPAAPGEGTMPLPTPSVPSKPDMPQMPEHSNCRGTLYTIESGDTLYMIAKKHRVNLNAIIDANPAIDPYNLMVGMQICIPR
ncbi:MAG: LysM peptidoglycan-binding domain-containing protein [Firmicutes bacterium]|nr:LysM peptidoglycan-binding domain-containing protein [Clostridiales bacterium]MBQ2747082.1 LysM peptidoglycan-binding domain-containing protein [Bacillota bacterium]MBQ3122677.1 LysM peptidoglycan-binding domain-containing protein [Bacillota bacterium]MBQ9972984.1 LysM peptidoglycan-binding domain-containing protein [Bacillota bacterium]